MARLLHLFLLAVLLFHSTNSSSSPTPSPLPADSDSPSPTSDSPSPTSDSPSPSKISLPPATSPSSSSTSPPAPPSADSPSPQAAGDATTPPPTAPAPAPESSDVSHSDLNADGDGSTKVSSEEGLSAGKKAGIGLGVIIGAAVLGVGGFVYKRRQENIRRSQYGYAARREML